jgi:adenine-specific DNA-methyltransferase
MSQNYEKLKNLLKELFQLDQPDLDFGLYRIMHAKSAEVSQFLDKDLLPQVRDAFALYKTADKAEIEKELAKATEQAKGLGVDPEMTQKVKDLRAVLANDAVDIGSLESEVYDHLFSFFRRYYSEGDFLSKRVYKPGVYAIPYEGEEVKLHWANADQYYIKTSEYLRDYAFRLRPDDDKQPMRVHFRLVDAVEGEHGNVKEQSGKERRFKLADANAVAIEDGELIVRFTYQPEADKQKELNNATESALLEIEEPGLVEWITALSAKHVRTDGTKSENTRLRVHLDRYTARNTFDYFIHKDLGTFLRRELDFFIKNEVMHLDDVENETAPRVEQYLSKIKVIRQIAGKIIAFLAQLEDFQKKLWLKKKFVVETQWCITVGCIPEAFYAEIAANGAQHEEWIKLFAINEIKGDLMAPGYSKKLKPEFLKAHPTLVVDTRHFDASFTERLLDVIGEVDEQTDGLLLHSENGQALSLMRARYQGQIECVHIDPPYNTQTSGFLYRNNYQHSSWLAMMAERLDATHCLLSASGALLCHIDENEYERLHVMCEELQLPNAGTVVWDKRNPMLGRKGVATQHEYVLWRTQTLGPLYLRNANQRLILENASRIVAKAGGVTEAARGAFSKWIASCPDLSGGERIYRMLEDDGRVFRGVAMGAPEPRTDPKFFVPLKHPVTGKPCPVPPNGWSRTPETLQDLIAKNEILFGEDEKAQPQRKVFLTEDSQRQVSSVIQDAGRGKADMDKLGLEFPYCHPLSLYLELVGAAAPSGDAIVLDFFAGSGTNGHAVIALNRDERTRRKLILVEVGEQFESVLVPRIKKATYTPEWKDGKPKRLATPEEAGRSPRIVKVVRLESYEDALNNLDTHRTGTQQLLLGAAEAQGADGLKEQYVLRYMLDVETRGSQSMLNVQAFTDPTAYKLNVKRPGSDESREVNVDLLETFNWLIGLSVRHIAAPQTFSAAFERDSENRLRLKGRLRKDTDGQHWFRTVTGNTPDGRRTLVIWRKLSGNVEEDNLVLDEWFTKQGYSSKDSEFDLIYVNGGNNLENLKIPDDLWKVRLIEEDFHRLMFETEGA